MGKQCETGGVAAPLLGQMAKGSEDPGRSRRFGVAGRSDHAEDPAHLACYLPSSVARTVVGGQGWEGSGT